MNTAQRIILTVFAPAVAVALMFALDNRPVRYRGGGFTTDSDVLYGQGFYAIESPMGWMIAIFAVALFELWLWQTPRKNDGKKGQQDE